MLLTLRTPFKDKFQERKTLNLREYLTIGDMLEARRQFPNDDIQQSVFLVARVTGLLVEDVDHMDVQDYDACCAHIERIRTPPKSELPAGTGTESTK